MCAGTGTDRNNPGENAGAAKKAEEEEVLAIGQKAAYFSRSCHFVNLVQERSVWILTVSAGQLELMMEAYRERKDTEQLVVQRVGVQVLPWDNHIESYRFIQ